MRNKVWFVDKKKGKCKKVLYVHSSDELYGADKVLFQLLGSLDRSKFEPIVVLPRDLPYQGLLATALRGQAVRICPIPFLSVLRRSYFSPKGGILYLYRLMRSTLFLCRLIRQENISLVHSNTLAVLPGAIAARILGIPHIWHVHEILASPAFLRIAMAWLTPLLSTRVVAISRAVQAHLATSSVLNRDKSVVIYNGIDPTDFDQAKILGRALRREWEVKPGEILIGVVGRISWWKGQEVFLKAASHLAPLFPHVRFVIVGDTVAGQEHLRQELERFVHQRCLQGKVLFTGFLRNIPAVMGALDLLVVPSRLPEPFGMVALEAMAAETAVIAPAHGGLPEIIEHRKTGLLVPPDHPEELALAIEALVVDEDWRESMGKAGRKRVELQFSMRAFSERWQRLYEEVLAGMS